MTLNLSSLFQGRFRPEPLGLAFVGAYVSWLNTSGHVSALGSAGPTTSGVALVTFVAFAVATRKGRPIPFRGPLCIGVSLLMCASSLAFLLGASTPLLAAGTVAAGAGYAYLYLAWGAFYTRLHLRDAFAYIFMAYALSSALKVVTMARTPVDVLVTCCFPMLSAWLLVRSYRRRDLFAANSSSAVVRRGDAGALWKFAACLLMYALVIACLRQYLEDDLSAVGFAALHVLEASLAIAVLAWTVRLRRPARFVTLWGALFAFVATALLALGLELRQASMVFTNLGTSFATILSWAVLVDFARHGSLSPYFVFAVGRIALAAPYQLVSLLGAPVRAALGPSGPGLPALVSVLFWALSISTMGFVGDRRLAKLNLFEELFQARRQAVALDDVTRACEALGEARGLTDREVQVMALACMGKSKGVIAARLSISESTVKTHMRNLYAKLGVHSRDELQELAGV